MYRGYDYLHFLISNGPTKRRARTALRTEVCESDEISIDSIVRSRVACNAFIRRVIICTGYIAKHAE